ncbi:MAG: filamentous hemagglutinin N-terminal domain-containing protein, partial [Chlamydiota bacterium]
MKIHSFFGLICPLMFSIGAVALPQGEIVVHGQAEVVREERGLSIKASDKAVINYDSFNIGEQERVEFIQPSSTSSVLNRVIGSDPSSILGGMTSNGKVFLVNQNGIYFGANARIDMGSLIASTLDILDQNFLEDRFHFYTKNGSTPGMIHNLGQITSKEGAIAFISPYIKNEGLVTASAGKVIFAAGEAVTLDFTGDGLMSFIIEGDAEKAVIEHLGSIQAGEVFMNLKVANRAIRDVVNTDDVIEGNALVKENGTIRIVHKSTIKADNVFLDGSDKMSIEGAIDVSNEASTGGTLHILGDHIALSGADINASGALGGGTVLIGGDYKGEGTLRNAITNVMDENS